MRKAADGERELVNLNWGFVLLQKGLAPRRVTNVRDDKILTSKFWRPSFEQRRCLVPASSYCEPKGEKPATWHWFALNGDEERPLFAFPGVWTRYRGPLKKNGDNVDQEVFAFMTTEPNALTASIRLADLRQDPPALVHYFEPELINGLFIDEFSASLGCLGDGARQAGDLDTNRIALDIAIEVQAKEVPWHRARSRTATCAAHSAA